MQKKNVLPIMGTVCLLLNLMLPIFKTNVFAIEKNPVTLNFMEATVQDGKAIYGGDSEAYTASEVSLVEKNFGEDSIYSNCAITGNNMEIDLNEKDYYLKITPKTLGENHDETLEAIGKSSFNRLYINNESYDITLNRYIKLDTNKFVGNLNIRLEQESKPQPTPSYPDNISIKATYDGYGMEIYFNSNRIGTESNNIIGTGKGYVSGKTNNLITIQLSYGDGNIGSVTVNEKEINLPENTEDRVDFAIEPASEYIISVKKAKNTSGAKRTIYWASNKKDNPSMKDYELLKNGTIEILDIKDPNGNSMGLEKVNQDTEKNEGHAEILPGSRVILKLKPNYGYQLTSIRINDEILLPREIESTFEYIMPDTNVHLSGIFEKVDDQVKIESSKVKEGKIEIDDSEIDSGSVILSVNDVDLTEEQISDFKEKAKEYDISSYLGIRLDRILYKGTADEVWSKQLTNLNSQATITLKLEEEVKGDEVVIVHEKPDGTYEIIPATYDSSTNTLTFKTSSFSNYAIASKTIAELEEGGSTIENNDNMPKTGDNIIIYIITFALAISALSVFLILSKKKRNKNKEDY